MRALVLAAALAVAACGGAAPSPGASAAIPSVSATPYAPALAVAAAEAVAALGPGVALVRAETTTLADVYGTAAGIAGGYDEPGTFAVYRAGDRYAEVFVRNADLAVRISRVTSDPVRR